MVYLKVFNMKCNFSKYVEKPVKLFVMGSPANFWREEVEWPLTRSSTLNYFLHSKGKANSLYGNGSLHTNPPKEDIKEEFDEYIYDPLNPVPTKGGCTMGAGTEQITSLIYYVEWSMGVFDQREVEMREDVLVYTSEPLASIVEITGSVTATIWASSSCQGNTVCIGLANNRHGLDCQVGLCT